MTDLRARRAQLHAARERLEAATTRRNNTINLITGPPCSGKTTHAQTHKRSGDIVIDYDLIAQAIGSVASHNHHANYRLPTLAAREAVIHHLATLTGITAWLIAANPTPNDHTAATNTITLNPGRDECHRRATAAHRPQETHTYIDAWYDAR